MHSRVHPTYKTKYRVANWASYDRALVRRGDITLWLSPAVIAIWEPNAAGTRGAQRKYSDLAIETALTIRLLFHLPLRQTEGFVTSIFVAALRARRPGGQVTETLVACNVLNQMTELGRPDSYAIGR
jgi:hypothetical protein